MSSKIGIKSNLRSTSEQLRLDHIATLQILQTYEDENRELKIKIEELTKEAQNIKGLDGSNDIAEARNPKTSKILDLLDENKKLQNQVDLLKEQSKKVSIDEQKKIDSMQARIIEDYNTRLLKQQAKERELNAEIIIIKELIGGKNTETESRLLQIEDLQSMLNDSKTREACLVEEVTKLSEESVALKDEITKLRKSSRTLPANEISTATLQKCIRCRDYEQNIDKIMKLEEQISTMASQVIHFQYENSCLKNENQVTCQSLLNLKSSIDSLEERLSYKIKELDELKMKKALLSDSSSQTDVVKDISCEAIKYDPSEDELSQDTDFSATGSRFQDFMKLKRENKQLKLQLAERVEYSKGSSIRRSNSITSGISQGIMEAKASNYGVSSSKDDRYRSNNPIKLTKKSVKLPKV